MDGGNHFAEHVRHVLVGHEQGCRVGVKFVCHAEVKVDPGRVTTSVEVGFFNEVFEVHGLVSWQFLPSVNDTMTRFFVNLSCVLIILHWL